MEEEDNLTVSRPQRRSARPSAGPWPAPAWFLEVVGVASTTAEAVARAEQLRPDVVLVDIHLSRESGFDLVRELHARMPTAEHRVILMSTHAEADFAELIATSPVDGFVPKDALSAQAIRRFLAPA